MYITTPIYYVNDSPHIGHAYTTVVGDALVRFYRLAGEEALYLTGTDEHGLKIARAAEELGLTPQELVDQVSTRYREAWDLLEISNDDFIRTTEDRHKEGAQAFLQTLYDRGDIYESRYEGLYCVSCEDYYKEDDLLEGGLCPIHNRAVEHFGEDNYFFRLSKYGDALLAHIEANPDFVFPRTRRNEVLGFIKQGLEDFSISRASLKWGIPIPWDESQVTYVWVEALMNYATAIGYGKDDGRFDAWWPAVHLVGKDIVRFHAIIWPAMLLAAGLEPPRQVAVHGWLLVGGAKMSKTALNQIAPADLVETFGVDGYRYHFLRDVSFGSDGSFTWEGMVDRYNADLANDLGNLANRVLNMVERYRDGSVPAVTGQDDADDKLRAAAATALESLDRFRTFGFHDALLGVWRLFGAANAYVEENAPWALAKDPASAERLDQVLNALLEALRVGAILISPVMPNAAARLWDQLGLAGRPDSAPYTETAVFGTFPPVTVNRGEPLFPRIEEG
ncbi:MAG: methionine--tRNA ligase [Acidimicrobiia bacterium]|nr:methionine--tRNA ligase [Acidimicrobiia bacterium]